ncbi:hypothetical protein [Pararhodospirillum photometricum]|uniref:hypothetical protein n=1 Tax=Pararhodospirillum photometricum TaxID=1084 RepID=UPI00031DD545|nr:hypothetical protein [Pararhodospirillum photometricum]
MAVEVIRHPMIGSRGPMAFGVYLQHHQPLALPEDDLLVGGHAAGPDAGAFDLTDPFDCLMGEEEFHSRTIIQWWRGG